MIGPSIKLANVYQGDSVNYLNSILKYLRILKY